MLGDERPEVTGGDGEGRTDGVVKAKGKPARKPRQLDPATPGVDMEAIFKLIAGLDEKRHTDMMEFLRESKKPSAKEAREEAENEKKEERIKAVQLRRIEDAKQQEQAKLNQMRGCSHATYHPGTGQTKHAWRAQVHTPAGVKPYFVPICLINGCQLKDNNGDLLKFPATTDMLTNGVNLDQYVNLDIDRLKEWFRQSTEQVA